MIMASVPSKRGKKAEREREHWGSKRRRRLIPKRRWGQRESEESIDWRVDEPTRLEKKPGGNGQGGGSWEGKATNRPASRGGKKEKEKG